MKKQKTTGRNEWVAFVVKGSSYLGSPGIVQHSH